MKTKKATFYGSLFVCTALNLGLHAATNFNGGAVEIDGNWSNNRPLTVGNPGTITVDGNLDATRNYDNYYVTHTAGTISSNRPTDRNELRGGIWTIDGGALDMDGGLNTATTQMLTLLDGSITTSSQMGITGGSTFNMSGGTLTTSGNNFYFNSGSTANISGGTLTTGAFGSMFSGSDGTVTFTGGTLNATTLNFRSPDFNLILGGTTPTAGSLNFSGGWGNITGSVDIRWESGSLMSMSLTGEADWAETQWNAGNMTFDGDDYNDLGVWSAVNGTVFDYNAATQTLSVIPEPSSIALLGLAGLAVYMMRRRK